MSAKRRDLGFGAMPVVVAGLAAVVLMTVLVAVAMARPLGFLHIRSNLSQAGTLISVYPKMGVAPDRDWVAAVWGEELRPGGGEFRGHVYIRAASEIGSGWGSKVPVFAGSDDVCANVPTVVVEGTTAHVAYVVSGNTCLNPTVMQVRYKTCALGAEYGNVSCDDVEETVASVNVSAGTITSVDLALDTNGNPHIVWTQHDGQGEWGEVLYSTDDGGGWSSPFTVASNQEGNKNNTAPAVAWADGNVHVAWEERTDNRIWYRRRTGTGWETAVQLFSPYSGLLLGNPDVVAGSNRVFVVWDCCSNLEAPDPSDRCSTYHLVYARSNNNGVHWSATMEVGTSYRYDTGFAQLEDYPSADEADEGDPYFQRLRPAIALNSDGWPAVVWHVEHSDGGGGEGGDKYYTVYYTYAVTGTSDSVSWAVSPPTRLKDYGGDVLCSAVVGEGEGETTGGEPLLHVAYMRRPMEVDVWDVYYDSNEGIDRYRYAYLPMMMKLYPSGG